MLNQLKGVFSSFHKHKVKHVVIGGIASVFKDVIRINVQTSTAGIAFENAWENRETMDYQGQKFFVVSKDDLIASKRAAGGDIDLEDIRLLELSNK